MTDLQKTSVSELLKAHASIIDELMGRGVLRTQNNPTGDYAEWVCCKAFGWDQAPNSAKGYDATDQSGVRYQIKGCKSASRQLSAIRDLSAFDVIAAVLFNPDYTIKRAALIPASVVSQRSSFSKHTNSHIFYLKDDVWDDPQVADVTRELVDD